MLKCGVYGLNKPSQLGLRSSCPGDGFRVEGTAFLLSFYTNDVESVTLSAQPSQET